MRRIGMNRSMASRRLAFAAILISTASTAFAQREAEGLSASIRKATARVAPAVVSIRPLGVAPQGGLVPPVVIPPVAVPPLVRFGVLPRPGGRVERLPSGSGLIIDANRGLAVTCGQVLRGAMQAEILLADGSIRPALRITVADPRSDLVLIEFDPKGTEPVQAEWADSRTLQLGDWVVAVGRSAMGKPIASAGIVSASVDPAEAGSELEPIQTDALITAETAGGPLVNLDGQVVGISQSRGEFVGGDPRDVFRAAIPEVLVRRVAGVVPVAAPPHHGYLGVTLSPSRRAKSKGVVVASVSEGSPAADAGLAPGDRILSIDGRVVRDAQALSRAVELAAIGQEMTLAVERQGKKFEAKFQTRPRPDVLGPPIAAPEERPVLESSPAPPASDEPGLDPPRALPDKPKPKVETP